MARKLYDLGFNGTTIDQGWEEDGKMIMTSVQPQWQLDAFVSQNKEIASGMGTTKVVQNRGGQGAVAARVPELIWHLWEKEWRNGPRQWGVKKGVFMRRKINSPEYKHLRFFKV